jgi:hypothetical protein
MTLRWRYLGAVKQSRSTVLGFALHGAQWDDGLNAIPFAVPVHYLGETLAGQPTIATFARTATLACRNADIIQQGPFKFPPRQHSL